MTKLLDKSGEFSLRIFYDNDVIPMYATASIQVSKCYNELILLIIWLFWVVEQIQLILPR